MGIESYEKFRLIDREAVSLKAREQIRTIRQYQHLQTHMSMRTISLCAAGFGAIMMASSVIIQIPMIKITDPAPVTGLAFIIGLMFVIFSIKILYGGKLLTIRRKRFFALITVISSILAVYINGTISLPWIPAGILFLHLLLPYRQSLYTSAFTIAMIPVALYFQGDGTVIGQHIRVIGASMSVLLMMQCIMRNISEIASDSMETTGCLNGLISKLESDLYISIEEKNRASSEDPESGLINHYGISLYEPQLLSRIENGEELIVAAIRCNRFSDSISMLPDKERYVLLSKSIRRIQDYIGEKSILARVSRNDYIAILENSDFGRLSTLLESFKEPISHGQSRIVITPFIGYVRMKSDCSDILLAVRKSEIALASATEQNRINAVEFDDNMLNSITDRNELLNDLAADVSLSQFELKFQPIIDLRSGEIHKFEALMRWNHPEKGIIPPNNFIPMAESSSLIFRMTDWVIATAHSKLLNLRESLGDPIKISVNIPAVYLENGAADKVIFINNLRAISSSFEGMILEITEGSMLRITPELTDLMNDLRDLHFEFALDDFGVGHSSLSRLENIPLSYLKIDKSFVDKIETSKTKYYICNTIIKFAHQLGLKVVAEGVENDLQHDLLKKAKCDFGQGYLFSKPVSAELLPGLVASCRLRV